MNAAFLRDSALSEEESRGRALGTAPGVDEEAEERAALERVEALANRFCEQVRGGFDALSCAQTKIVDRGEITSLLLVIVLMLAGFTVHCSCKCGSIMYLL